MEKAPKKPTLKNHKPILAKKWQKTCCAVGLMTIWGAYRVQVVALYASDGCFNCFQTRRNIRYEFFYIGLSQLKSPSMATLRS